ncbi:MAG: hypothetical protein H0U67_12535 [Gemmatimonadetes bacterium]|nr:hypothetical protein [Gemmatimonadota bacterium]
MQATNEVFRPAALGLILLLSAAAACSDGGSYEAVGPSTKIAEGSRINGSMIHTGSLTTAEGATVRFDLPSQLVSATVRNGLAVRNRVENPATIDAALPSLAPMLAATADRSDRETARQVSFTDPDGRRHELHMVRSGTRLLRAEHRIDGEVFASIKRTWREQNGAWVLENANVAVFSGGAQLNLAAELSGEQVAQRAEALKLLASAGAVAGGYFLPQELHASCWGATLQLFATSGALSAALVALNPVAIVITAAAYLSAIDYYAEQC